MFLRRSLRCSFCRRHEHEVSKLVAGAKAYICDECVALAGRIMEGESDDQQRLQPTQNPWRRLGNFIRNLLHPGMMRRRDELATG